MEIFGNDDRLPNQNDLNAMKYLEMVIKETMRLDASVPLIGRRAVNDVPLSKYMYTYHEKEKYLRI